MMARPRFISQFESTAYMSILRPSWAVRPLLLRTPSGWYRCAEQAVFGEGVANSGTSWPLSRSREPGARTPVHGSKLVGCEEASLVEHLTRPILLTLWWGRRPTVRWASMW